MYTLLQAQHYVARSAFKLLEMQQKHKLIRPGASVLDLGCSPGAWLQVACQSLGPHARGGNVLGIDMKAVQVPKQLCDDRVTTLQADVTQIGGQEVLKLSQGLFGAVLSDMCHSTTGFSAMDATRSLQLATCAAELAVGPLEAEGSEQQVLEVAQKGLLQPGGNMLIKLLQGSGSQELAAALRYHFHKVCWARPAATRSESREMYLLGLMRR
eukprot:jgi/Astpho2/7481/e_gw1.00114.145.1_t